MNKSIIMIYGNHLIKLIRTSSSNSLKITIGTQEVKVFLAFLLFTSLLVKIVFETIIFNRKIDKIGQYCSYILIKCHSQCILKDYRNRTNTSPCKSDIKKFKKKKKQKEKKETRKRGRRYIVQFFTVAAKRTIEILTKRSFILT